MKERARNLFAVAAVAAVLLFAAPALAGGLNLYEVGSPDVGLAAAGYAARAQDASTAFTNPAGMTRLERPELMAGAQPMYLSSKFSPDAATRAAQTGPDGDASAFIPAGSFFYSHPVTKDLRLGFASFGNFGLSLKYENDWVGRYYVQEATLQGMTFMPSAAYRVSPKLSVGAGLGVMYVTFSQKMAVPTSRLAGSTQPDGRLTLEDHDWAYNGKFGLLYEPAKGTRLGATYTTQTVVKLSPGLDWNNPGPVLDSILQARGMRNGSLELGMRIPQGVMVSAFHDVSERLSLMANAGWEEWSKFGKVDIGVRDNTSTTTRALEADLDYKDTWHGALGAQYKLSDPWLLSCGMAYDSAFLDDAQRTVTFPVGDTWRFAFGAQNRYSEKVTLGAAYELAWSGNLPVSQGGPVRGPVSGEYQNGALHVVSLNLGYKF